MISFSYTLIHFLTLFVPFFLSLPIHHTNFPLSFTFYFSYLFFNLLPLLFPTLSFSPNNDYFFSCSLALVLIFLSPLPFYFFSSLSHSFSLNNALSLCISSTHFFSPLSFYFSSSFISPSHSFSPNNSLFFYLSLIFLSPLTFYFSSLTLCFSFSFTSHSFSLNNYLCLSFPHFSFSLMFSSSHFFTLPCFSPFHTLFPSLIFSNF